MCDFLAAICPCIEKKPEDDFDIISGKGDYHGSRDITGARNGFGIYRFENGDIYEGEWKKDKKHGCGEYRFRDGKILNGYFENDTYVGQPQRSHSSFASSEAQPLLNEDIKSDQKPIKIKENTLTYSFAKTVHDIKHHVKKKKKKKEKKHQDEIDHSHVKANENQKLLSAQQNNQCYTQTRPQMDPEFAANLERERYQRERERQERHRERVDKIRKKYNIPGGGYVHT